MRKALKNKVQPGDTLSVNKKNQLILGDGVRKESAKVLEVIDTTNGSKEGDHLPLFKIEVKIEGLEGKEQTVTHRFFDKIIKKAKTGE